MRRATYFRFLPLPAVCLLLLTSALPAWSETGPLIKLAGRRFDPQLLPNSSRLAQPETGGYYILQFDGPVEDAWKARCEEAGVEFLDYVPDFAFIVRLPSEGREAVEALPHVRWLGDYLPAYRLSEELRGAGHRGKAGKTSAIVVIFKGADLSRIISRIEEDGGKIISCSTTTWKSKLQVEVEPGAVERIAEISGVKWVEEPPRFRLLNNEIAGIVGVRSAWNNHTLFGSGQIVGVADTGLDEGSISSANLLDDFENGSGSSRVLAIANWTTDSTEDIIGHGTHVAGTVLGNGANSGSSPATRSYPSTCYAGIAPEASLIVQKVFDDSGVSNIPSDLNILFAQAHAAGAKIHNNSWGADVHGEYTSSSEDVDEYSWDNKDFLIIFSAGNSGVDSNFDGVIDLYSVGSPATAKNCVAVGATENDRSPGSVPSPGYPLTYGWYWPSDYPAEPINSDYLSDDPYGMAAFSSRGAELSARYKPDIVAPGTNVVSARTQAISSTDDILWGSGGLTGGQENYYVYSGGTSMSAPVVSGAAAVIRQYYTDVAGITPSAALLKATLLNGAQDIYPGQYGTGATQEVPNPPRPNNVEGWGLVDLSSTVLGASPLDFGYYDVTPGLSTGQSAQYQFTVSPSSLPLSVTLAWTDHPGTTPAGGALVNDLDLTVTDPAGTVYYPNNALRAGPIAYDDGMDFITRYYSADEGMVEAVRFTPTCYPATLDRAIFYLLSRSDSYSKTFTYRVYRGGAGGPGSLLGSGTSVLRAEGWHSIDLSHLGITINSGDFYLALVLPDDDLGWRVDLTDPVAERSWEYSSMTGWYKWMVGDYMFRAVVSCPTLADRTNNVEGIDIAYPIAGNYTVRVNAYNVPYGPQPYALVASRPVGDLAMPEKIIIDGGDYDGDGDSDVAVYRPRDALWAIRGLSRYYYGLAGDVPAPGDYNGDGTTESAVFRPTIGLWGIRGLSRFYLGQRGDIPVPDDYDGDGTTEPAIFRQSNGLWRVRNVTGFYFGAEGDLPVPGHYEGSAPSAAVFRPKSGLWALRGFSRFYFGASGDIPAPADYDLFAGDDMAIFRPSTGLWYIFGYTRYYFGRSGGSDQAVPADYDGDGVAESGIFRGSSGLWAVRDLTRLYYGEVGDVPVTR